MDKEKVIKGLEICTTRPCYCTDCPYKKECCLDSQNVMEDALSLLKEQEIAYQGAEELLRQKMILFEDAIQRLKKQETKWIHREDLDFKDKLGYNHFHGMCENCGFVHDFIDGHTGQYKYCPQCGRTVKWE